MPPTASDIIWSICSLLHYLHTPRYYLTARFLHATAPARVELYAEVLVRVHAAPRARRLRPLRSLRDLWHEPVIRQSQLVPRHVPLLASLPVGGEVGGLAFALDLDLQAADLGHHPARVEGQLQRCHVVADIGSVVRIDALWHRCCRPCDAIARYML
eukprot:scaffold31813_cov62-Phaeocystis_antarctica.AAC.3